MRGRRRLFSSAVALSSLVASLFAGAVSVGASVSRPPYVIGVDNANPAGDHNFEYVDYFPRGQILPTDSQAVVGNGAILDFKYLGGRDGLHTATLIPTTETPEHASARLPLVTFDGDNGEAHPILNPKAVFQDPCGQSAATACTYAGITTVNSGALPAFTPSLDFFVRINLATSMPTTVHYVCLIHPGMQGKIRVVPGRGSSPAAFADNATTQYAADTADALAAEAAATTTAQAGNFVVAGTATQFVEVAEMLPKTFSVAAGGQVAWKTLTIRDPHTVTFPAGAGSDSVDPLTPPYAPAECEGNPESAPDTPIAGPPPTFGCSTVAELGFNPFPNGVTAITSPATVATSGIISSPPSGLPSTATFSFPNGGTFPYQCRIHDDMTGTITVAP